MAEPKRDIASITFSVATILGLAFASFWTLRPFLGAAIWATMIVVATWPVMIKLQKALKGKRWAAVTVMCVASLLIFVVPFTLAVGTVVDNIPVVQAWLAQLQTSGLPAAPDWFQRVPLVSDRLIAGWNSIAATGPNGLSQTLEPYMARVFQWIVGMVGSVGGTLVQFLLMVGIGAVMWAQGERAVAGLSAFSTRLAGSRGPMIVKLAAQSIRGVAMGVVLTALIQATLAAIALLVAGVPHVALIVMIVFMCCVVQIGPLFALVPCAIWIFSQGRTAMGIFFVVLTLVLSTVDNVIRPFLIKRGGADLSLLLIIGGVVGGLLSFGLLGIFIGPVTLAVTYTLIAAWVTGEMKA